MSNEEIKTTETRELTRVEVLEQFTCDELSEVLSSARFARTKALNEFGQLGALKYTNKQSLSDCIEKINIARRNLDEVQAVWDRKFKVGKQMKNQTDREAEVEREYEQQRVRAVNNNNSQLATQQAYDQSMSQQINKWKENK